jgi:hypothetical protein
LGWIFFPLFLVKLCFLLPVRSASGASFSFSSRSGISEVARTMSRPLTRRKCRCCSKFFLPDPRTEDRQRYCSQRACRHASKMASQRRWLKKDGNGDQFRGPNEVLRVQRWRRDHPGYWKRTALSSQGTQPVDEQRLNPDQSSRNATRALPTALQDDCLTENPMFIGLISMFTGSTLQEDIATTTRQLLLRGRNILGGGLPETTPTTIEPRS